MHIIDNLTALRQTITDYRSRGQSISLVPTMGALHAGHLSLITQAKQQSDVTIATLFINPKQFASHEDLDSYPKTQETDLALLEQYGTTIAYLPHKDNIYPEGFSTSIHIAGDLHDGLCSTTRPHFFDGVALVVLKLFLQTQPDIAIFGEKDYQQLCIIRKMVKDLDLPITVMVAPLVRETDGLALSSRNSYLSEEDRAIAPQLYSTLQRIQSLIKTNHHDVRGAIEWGKNQLTEKGFAVDYIELRQELTLKPLHIYAPPCRLLTAATLGTCRLLDNISV